MASQAHPEGIVTVGIAGGSGSGKSTLAQALVRAWPFPGCVVSQDWYYRDAAHVSDAERTTFNFDAPEAIESDLMAEHLQRLRGGQAIPAPQYDFRLHTRRESTLLVEPAPLLCVEGLHVLGFPAVRQQLDLAVYVDCSKELRLLRRIARDRMERGRTAESVRHQFLGTVEPMYERHVAPSRAVADLVIPGDQPLEDLVARVCARIQALNGTIGGTES